MKLIDTIDTGTPLGTRNQGLPLEQPPDSAWGKGLRRGMAGLHSAGKAFGAQLAEPFAPEWSRQQIAEASANMQDVVAKTPLVDRIENIKSPGDFGEWAAGTIAQAVPSIGVAMGGAALGRLGLGRLAPNLSANTASILGAGATTVPLEGGGTAMDLHGDPTAMENTTPWGRVGLTAGRGLVGGAMESIVPGMMTSRIMRGSPLAEAGPRSARAHIGGATVKGMGTEAATEAGQHLTGTFAHSLANPDVEVVNALDLANAAAAGAAPGAAMGGIGGAADAIHGNLNAAGRQMRKPYDWVRDMTPQGLIDDAGRAGAATRDMVDSASDFVTRSADWVKDKTGIQAPKWPGRMTDEEVMEAAYRAGLVTRVAGVTAKQSYEAFKEGFLRDTVKKEQEGDSTPFTQRVMEFEDLLLRKAEDAKNMAQAGATAFGAGYGGRDLNTGTEAAVTPEPPKDLSTRIREATGKTVDEVIDGITTGRNIDTSDPEKFTMSVAEQGEIVDKILTEMASDREIRTHEAYADAVDDLLNDPDVKTDPAKHRRVVEIAKQFRDSRAVIDELLRKMPKTEQKGSASRQMTDEAKEIFASVKRAVEDTYHIGGKDGSALIKAAELGNSRAYEDALNNLRKNNYEQGTIDVLRELGPKLPTTAQIADKIARRPARKSSGKNTLADQLGEFYFNKDFINSRVRDYVANAVKGTPYDGTSDRLSIESAVMGMLEAVSNDTMTNQQVQSVRATLEKALGEAGNTLFEATMEAAGHYTQQGKFSAMRERPAHKPAVEALQGMRHDKTPPGGKHEQTTTLLAKLVTQFMNDDTKLVRGSSQYGERNRELASLRERGLFEEAVALQASMKAELDDPYAAYNKSLKQYFGPKAKSADAVIRNYAKQLGHEIESNGQQGTSGTGRVAEDDLDDYENRQKALQRQETMGDQGGLDEKQVATKNNELGTHGQEEDGFGSEDRYFGQSGKSPEKFDEYPGAPLTSSPTYEHPDGELSAVKDRIDATWGGLRNTHLTPIKWAEERGGDPETLLTDAAEALLAKDLVDEKRLKRLKEEEGIKIHKGQVIDRTTTRKLLDDQLSAIQSRRALWENSKSGTAFFNDSLNSGLRFIKSGRARGTMLENNKDTTDRLEHENTRAGKTKWLMDMKGRSPASDEVLENSLIKLRAADGKVFNHDIAGDVANMMRRNQQGDVSGVFEKGIEPTMKEILKGAFSTTITSLMMSGDYDANMLVNGGKFDNSLVIYRDDVTGQSITYGEVFGLKPNEQAAFTKEELNLIIPKESGADAYRKANADLEAARAANPNTGVYESNVTAPKKAAAEQAQKFIASKSLVDKNNREHNFNPRMMLKALMTRHGMDADKYLPANTSSEGLSAVITDKLIKEGMGMLAKQGYRLATETPSNMTVLLWETDYGDVSYPMPFGRSFARKNIIETENAVLKLKGEPLIPAWGEYTGTFDIRADKIARQNERTENLIKEIAKLETELSDIKAVKNSDRDGSKRAKVNDDIAEARESLTKAIEELFVMMGWSERDKGTKANRFSKVDTDNARIEEAYRDAKRPVVKGEEQTDAQATETPALFDVSQLYGPDNQIKSDTGPNEIIAPKEDPEFMSVFKLFDEIMAEINADLLSTRKLDTVLQAALKKAVAEGKIAEAEKIRREINGVKGEAGRESTMGTKARIAYLRNDLKNKMAIRNRDLGDGMRVSVSNDKMALRGQEAAKKAWFDDVIKEAMRLPKPAAVMQPSTLNMIAGKMGKSDPVTPDTMTVENKLYRPEVNIADARAEAYRARLTEVRASLDARKARRKPYDPDNETKPDSAQNNKAMSEMFGLIDSIMEDAADNSYTNDQLNTAILEAYEFLKTLPGYKMPTQAEFVAAESAKFRSDARPKAYLRMSAVLSGVKKGSASKQSADSGKKGTQSEDAVRADVERRLGDTVEFFMRSMLRDGNAGYYTPPGPDQLKAILEVSMTMPNWGGVAAHESWHEVGRLMGLMGAEGKHIIETINKAMLNPDTYAMLKDHFKNDPGVLKQMEPGEGHNYLEERAAFAFQVFFENGGKMPMVPRVRGIFTKLVDMFKKMIGITDDLIKTENFFKYFDEGQFLKDMENPQSVLAALNETRREKYLEQLGRAVKPLRSLVFAAFGHAADRIKEMNIPAYTDVFERMHVGEGENLGYMKEQATRMKAFFNEFARIVDGLDGKLTPEAEAKIAELVRRIEYYKEDAKKGSVTKVDYDLGRTTFPFTADLSKIEGRIDEFREDLKTYGGLQSKAAEDIDEVINQLMLDGYYAEAGLFRDYPEKAKKYATDDINRQAFAYIKKSTHQAEMARAFKDKTLEQMLEIGDKDATPYQRSLMRTFTNAATGRAGLEMSPHLRKLFGTVITGINVSLLPFAVFTQMIEPMQLAFRKNDLKSAVGTAFRGFKGMPRMFEAADSAAEKDFFEKVAGELGLVTEAATVSMMADLMNEVPITGFMEKVNKVFFRYNGMEFWHRTMYAAATENAFGYIKDHAEDKDILAELQIKPEDVKFDKEGRVDHTDPKMRAAIIRFAVESMAQPDAATNTMWMNDPRLSLIAHLKRFTFGFSYYINSRAVNHLKKGEYRQLAPLAFAVPWMMAVDQMRDFVRPGEEAWKANWGVTDHVAHAATTTGVVGRYGIGLDALKTMDYGGSAVEAFSPAAQITGKLARGVSEGHGWEALFNTLPGHQLVGS